MNSDDRHLKIMIESMSREGRSEREIVAALRRAGAHEPRGRRDDSAQRHRKRS